MVYIAKRYVPIGGQMIKPGEAFDAELTEKQKKWLLSQGAIEETGATLKDVFRASGIEALEDAIEDEGGHDDSGNPEDDGETEPEAPEIDVMDGISTDEEKPKKKKG